MAQLSGMDHLVCLPHLSFEAAGEGTTPDLAIYPASTLDPDLFNDREMVAEPPLVVIDIMDGRCTMNDALEQAHRMELAGVRSNWIVEPVSHSVLVLEEGAGKRQLYHGEKVEKEGVAVDFARIFGAGVEPELPVEVAGEHRLIESLRGGEQRILLPSMGAESWRQLFVDPDKHWKRGMPTRALAHSWEAGRGMPPEVKKVLDGEPLTRDARPLMVLPEHQVPLPGGARPAHNDIWMLAEGRGGLASISVDGKARESFGVAVNEWYSGHSEGKERRLRYLCEQLELPFPPAADLRYGLLQKAASAVIEARRFKAPLAILMIHSFSSSDHGMEQFDDLKGAMGLKSRSGELVSRTLSDGLRLGFVWVRGERRFLDA